VLFLPPNHQHQSPEKEVKKEKKMAFITDLKRRSHSDAFHRRLCPEELVTN